MKKPLRKSKVPEQEPDVVKIDMMDLHNEWARQPQLFRSYATQLADAKERVNTAKAKVELTEAELANAVRRDPEAFGLEKATEKATDNVVKEQEEYQTAVARYNKARHKQDLLQAVVDALEHKKKALENLVQLHAMSYFSEPTAKDPARTRKSR